MSLIAILSLIAIFALGIFRILEKFIGINLHPLLGAIFIYIVALISTTIAFFIVRPEVKFDFSFKKGLIFALFAGICIAVFDVAAFLFFKKGGNVSVFTPLVHGGALLIVAVIGFFLLRESLNLAQVFGILVILFGIILLAR